MFRASVHTVLHDKKTIIYLDFIKLTPNFGLRTCLLCFGTVYEINMYEFIIN